MKKEYPGLCIVLLFLVVCLFGALMLLSSSRQYIVFRESAHSESLAAFSSHSLDGAVWEYKGTFQIKTESLQYFVSAIGLKSEDSSRIVLDKVCFCKFLSVGSRLSLGLSKELYVIGNCEKEDIIVYSLDSELNGKYMDVFVLKEVL